MTTRATTPPYQQGDVGSADETLSKEVLASKKEVQRILKCDSKDYNAIIGIEEGADQEATRSAFERVAILVHAKVAHNTNIENSKEAFNRVLAAAKQLDIDDATVAAINEWSGSGGLYDDKDDNDDSESGDSHKAQEHSIAEPPDAIKAIYDLASPNMVILRSQPDDETAIKVIHELNQKVQDICTDKMIEDDLKIAVEWFTPHYKVALQKFAEITKHKAAGQPYTDAENAIKTERDLMQSYLASRYLPMEWIIPTVAQYLEEGSRSDPTSLNAQPEQTEYPWKTLTTPEGVLIIGVRKSGNSFRVTSERNECGRQILLQETLAEVGLKHADMKKLYEEGQIKDLSKGQDSWKARHKTDFEEILKCSKAVHRRRNEADHRRPKQPSTDYIVKFRAGLEVLTYSSLKRVLGKKRAEAEILRVCKRDDIAPPWEAPTWVLYNDPAAAEADPAERRKLRLEQEKVNQSSNVTKLEELQAGQASLVSVVGELRALVELLSARKQV